MRPGIHQQCTMLRPLSLRGMQNMAFFLYPSKHVFVLWSTPAAICAYTFRLNQIIRSRIFNSYLESKMIWAMSIREKRRTTPQVLICPLDSTVGFKQLVNVVVVCSHMSATKPNKLQFSMQQQLTFRWRRNGQQWRPPIAHQGPQNKLQWNFAISCSIHLYRSVCVDPKNDHLCVTHQIDSLRLIYEILTIMSFQQMDVRLRSWFKWNDKSR